MSRRHPSPKARAAPKRSPSPAGDRRPSRGAGRRSRSGSPSARQSISAEKSQAKQAVADFLIAAGETTDFTEMVIALMDKKGSLLAACAKPEDAPKLSESGDDGARGNTTADRKDAGEVDVIRIFRHFDQNGNGEIEREELALVLRKLDPDVWTEEALDKLMALADTNGDGHIQYNEFVEWAYSSTFAPYKSAFHRALPSGLPAVDASIVEQSMKEAKFQLFEKLMDMYLPAWILEDVWKTLKRDVVTKTLHPFLSSELFKVFEETDLNSPVVAQLWRDALFKIVNDMDMWTCPVCCTAMIEVPEYDVSSARSMWKAPLRKTEHWSNIPCGHQYCFDCMKTWAESEINSMKINIMCMAPGCNYKLWDQDLEAVVSPEVFARYKEHKHADYAKRLATDVKADPTLKKWLEEHAKPCPTCHAIISRSAGCSVMTCTCGTRFCYACGFIKCQCSVPAARRADVWSPDEAVGS